MTIKCITRHYYSYLMQFQVQSLIYIFSSLCSALHQLQRLVKFVSITRYVNVMIYLWNVIYLVAVHQFLAPTEAVYARFSGNNCPIRVSYFLDVYQYISWSTLRLHQFSVTTHYDLPTSSCSHEFQALYKWIESYPTSMQQHLINESIYAIFLRKGVHDHLRLLYTACSASIITIGCLCSIFDVYWYAKSLFIDLILITLFVDQMWSNAILNIKILTNNTIILCWACFA